MEMTYRPGYSGSGPGELTPDGCAVELYKRLPPDDSHHLVAAAVPPPATLLELGCGVGRMTGPLADLGYDMTAVDESAAMLACVRSARTVQARVEDLDLGKTFDVVLLASFLVHAGDVAVRRALLATCRRHVAPGGVVLIQREGLDWHRQVPRERPILDGVLRVVSSEDIGAGVRRMRSEYVFPDATWTQTFLSRPLSVEQFEAAVAEAGLHVDRYLDELWALARTGAGAGGEKR